MPDLVSRDEVPNEKKNAHNDMFGDRGDVGTSDLENFDTLLNGCVEVDVIGTDTGSNASLQVLRLGGGQLIEYRLRLDSGADLSQEIGVDIAWVERGSDDDIGLQ